MAIKKKTIKRSNRNNKLSFSQRIDTIRSEFIEIFRLAKQEKLTTLLLWLLGITIVGSLIFYLTEVKNNPAVDNYGEALYWSIISVSTVGYGDISPNTTFARTVTIIMILSYMALMPLIAATITSIYISKRIKGESGLEQIKLKNHIVICGWNNNAQNVLAGLQETNDTSPVVLIGEFEPDHFKNLVDRFPQLDLYYVQGPYTSETTLKRANVRYAKVAMVMISYSEDSLLRSDEMAVLTVLALREIGPNIRIIAECFATAYRGHLRRAGANEVIVSGEVDSFMLTAAALSPGLDASLKDVLTFGRGSTIWTAEIPKKWIGKSFKELSMHLLDNNGWILIGMIQENKTISIGDVISGEESGIDEFITRQFEMAGRGQGGSQHLHNLNPGPDYAIHNDDQAIVIFPAEV